MRIDEKEEQKALNDYMVAEERLRKAVMHA